MTSRERCRLAMVGTGRIAFEGHVPAYRANDDIIEVVAVVDPDAARRTLVASALPAPPTVSTRTLDEALAATPLDAVVIASPPAAHCGAVVHALERGLAVVCEKPLSRSLEELELIRAAVGRTGGYLSVMHNYLYKPGWRALLDLVASGRIGAPVMTRFEELSANHWRAPEGSWREAVDAGGGPLRDNLYHVVYLAERLLRSPIVDVGATQASLLHKYRAGDTAVLDLVHANGSLTQATSAWCYTGRRRGAMEVIGTDACVRYAYWERPDELVVEQGDSAQAIAVDDWELALEWGYIAAFRDAIQRFLDGGNPPCGIDEAARVIDVFERAGTEVGTRRRRRRRLSGRRGRRS